MRCLLVVVVFLLIVSQAFAGLEDSVVGLYVHKGGSVDSEVGSGFYTTKNGQIMTAYHIVRGATKIKVRDAQENWYHDLTIEYIAPDHDLAVLQITELVETKSFLIFSNRIPPPSEQLRIIGYPRGLPRQHIYARSTSDHLLGSFAFRTPRGKRLFKKEIQVIPLDALIYEGMSGAPVLGIDAKVLGVLSGSLTEGGTIAWAIPIKRSDIKNYVRLGKRPKEISTWPDLPVHPDFFRSLTRSYRINEVGERYLEDYLHAVSLYSSSSDRISNTAWKLQAQIFVLRPMLQMVLSDPALSNDRQAVNDLLEFPVQEFLKALNNFGQTHSEFGSASGEVGKRGLDLANWGAGEKNLGMDERRRLDETLYRLRTEYKSTLSGYYHAIGANEVRLNEATAKLGRNIVMMGRDQQTGMSIDFARALLDWITAMEHEVQKHCSQEAVMYLRRSVSKYRSIASAFEPVVYRRKP